MLSKEQETELEEDLKRHKMHADTMHKKLGAAGSSGPVGARNGVEKAYAQVHLEIWRTRQALGDIGYVQPKKKYRRGS